MNKKFTLLELIVVIAVIGVLVTLLLPSLSRARMKAKKAVCLSNTSQVFKLLTVNSINYGGRVFARTDFNGSPSENPWDLPKPLYDEMGKPGRNIFYCPIRKERNADHRWNFSDSGTNFRVTGYIMTFKRLSGGLKKTLVGGHEWVESFHKVTDPQNNPFVADTVIYQNGFYDNRTEANFNLTVNPVQIFSAHYPEGERDASQTFTDGHGSLIKFGKDISKQTNEQSRDILW